MARNTDGDLAAITEPCDFSGTYHLQRPTRRSGSSAATVYYDPADPAKIEVSTHRTPVISFMTGVIPILIGLALLIAGSLVLAGHISITRESALDLVRLGRWRL